MESDIWKQIKAKRTPREWALINEIASLREANGAALAILPVRKNPTNDLQRLVNLAAGLLRIDDN